MAARPVTAYPITVHPETLRHYALLADGERGALVGPRGNVSFLCAPRWHDEAVLSDWSVAAVPTWCGRRRSGSSGAAATSPAL